VMAKSAPDSTIIFKPTIQPQELGVTGRELTALLDSARWSNCPYCDHNSDFFCGLEDDTLIGVEKVVILARRLLDDSLS